MKLRQAGFTLLEVLVALVVFGLLIGGLTQGMRYGLRAWETQVRMTDRQGDLDAVDRALRRMIETMDPGDGVDAAPISTSRDRLSFISVLPDAAGTLPARRAEVALMVDSSHRMVLQTRPYLHAERFGPGPQAAVNELLAGVSRLELAYWQPSGGWVGGWRGPDLPALIRIRVVFPPGDRRHWPDIVAAPQLDRP